MRRVAVALVALSCAVLVGPAPTAEGKSRRLRASCDDAGCEAGVGTTEEGQRRSRKRRTTSPVTCRYFRLDVPEGFVFTRPDGTPIPAAGPGQWYEKVCVDRQERADIVAAFADLSGPLGQTQALQQVIQATDRIPIWVRRGTPPLVEEALSRMTFPDGQPRFSPSSPWTFANHPTSLWLEGGLAPVSTSAEVPGLRVTVTGTPQRIEWDTADGAVLSCPAPGDRRTRPSRTTGATAPMSGPGPARSTRTVPIP